MITASIVTYHNSEEEISKLATSLLKENVNHIYIIDNSSNDLLRTVINDPAITYIHSMNVGYGKAHNIAIKLASKKNSTYHIIVNPDIEISHNCISALKEFMDNKIDCGLVMPQIKYPNGEIQYLCKLLPTPTDLIIRRFIPFSNLQKKIDYTYELRMSNYNKIMEVPSLSGCFMFIRTDILKQVGGFDESFFMYAEDVDLCRRIGKISKTFFYPHTYVIHSYEKGSYKNYKLLKYHITSIIKYFNKWGWFFDKKRTSINKQCILNIKNNSK